jgi:hypothetical protein
MDLLSEIIDFKNKHNFKTNYNYKNKYILTGGSSFKVKISDVLGNENEIKFKEIYNDKKRKIILNTKIENKKYNCIIIVIDEETKIATLDSVQVSETKCIDLDDFGLKTTGKFHLKVAIKMLKKYKDEFKINKIELEDIATVKCNEEEFPLSSYLLLTKGYTFYGKEGFKYKNEKLNLLLDNYQKYVDKLKVKQVDFTKILKASSNSKLNNQIIKIFNDNMEKKFIELLGIIFSRENMLNDEICQLYLSIRNELIFFYQNLLGVDYFDLFMPNLKMVMIL